MPFQIMPASADDPSYDASTTACRVQVGQETFELVNCTGRSVTLMVRGSNPQVIASSTLDALEHLNNGACVLINVATAPDFSHRKDRIVVFDPVQGYVWVLGTPELKLNVTEGKPVSLHVTTGSEQSMALANTTGPGGQMP